MTSLILNGKAVCCMHMGNFDEAETLLLDALNKASFKPINQLAFVHYLISKLVVFLLVIGKLAQIMELMIFNLF